VWTVIEVAVTFVGGVPQRILALQLLEIAATAGCALLIWKILIRVRPGDRLLGTIAFLWNPVIIVELGGEGHNDGIVIALVLAGLLATLTGLSARAIALTGFGVLTKFLPLNLAPAQLVYLWRTAPDRGRVARQVLIGAGLAFAALIAFVLAEPGWAAHMFDGLQRQGRAQPFPTFTGMLVALLEANSIDAADMVTIAATGCLVIAIAWTSWRVRTAEDLLRALAVVATLYAVALSALFLPWYVALPIALLSLIPRGSWMALLVVLTAVSRIVAPLIDVRPEYLPFPDAQGVVMLAGLAVSALALLFAATPIGPRLVRSIRTVARPGEAV
jgi:hypothetical protein